MKRVYTVIVTVIAVSLLTMSAMAQDPFYYEEFDDGLGTWWIGFEGTSTADGVSSIDDQAMLSGDNSLMIEIFDGGSANWHIQALDHLSSIDSTTSYDVYFMAATDADGPVDCDIVWSDPVTYTSYEMFNHQIDPEPKAYGPFTWVAETNGNVDLKFWLGQNDPTIVWLDSVVVVETPENAVGGCCPDELASSPDGFALEQNFPNPFNPSTNIAYTLAERSDLTLSVYNLEGRHVRTHYNGPCNAGPNQVTWDGLDSNSQPVSSGVYIYRMDAKGTTQTYSASNKMFLIK